MPIPLIDGDILVYRAGFSAQRTCYDLVNKKTQQTRSFEAGVTKTDICTLMKDYDLVKEEWDIVPNLVVAPLAHACQAAKLILKQILAKFQTEEYNLYLTSDDKSNFRYDIAKTKKYKGNRTAPRPVHYNDIREYLINMHGAIMVYGKEADDQMGLDQEEENTVICSIDKDMRMIPGWHYNFVKDTLYLAPKGAGELRLTNLASGRVALEGGGLKWFYAQMLLGDSADNIPGITGVGAKGAFKLLNPLNTEKELYRAVKKVYSDRKVEERLEEVANLLWIQRTSRERWKK